MGGPTGGEVFAIYLVQVIGLACLGALPGLASGGAAVPDRVGFRRRAAVAGRAGAHAGALGLALLPAFSPQSRLRCRRSDAQDVPVSTLFRDKVAGVQLAAPLLIVATVAVAAALVGLAVALAHDQRAAAIFVAAAGAVLVALRLIARC